MGKTYRHGCDYGKKPNPRITRSDIAGAGKAVEVSIIESLETEVDNTLRQDLFLLSLDVEVEASLRDRLFDDLYSIGEQAIVQEIELVG